MTTAPETKSHSRQPKGECVERLGKKLDALIAEVQHEASCESACCAPIAVIERPPEMIEDVVDPPQGDDCGGAVVAEGQPVESAGTGGSACFNHQVATVWDVFSGQPQIVSDIGDFLKELDGDPRLRSSANLRTMSRVREHLERIPETAAMGDPVELRLQDVLVLMDQLMRRMR